LIDAGPALWLPPKPAIIIQKEVPEVRLNVNNEDVGHSLPKDYLALPSGLRWTVPTHEIIKALPEPYRLLSDDLILAILGGWPGPLMAGGIKTSWLFTANGTLTIPGDWNKADNAIHGVGRGGNGSIGIESDVFPGTYYAGAGGGGGAWALILNRIYAVANQLAVTIAISSGDTSVGSDLVAKSGSNAGGVSGGASSGGQGGQASASTGDQKNDGGNGFGVSGRSTDREGGGAGGAGGPNGAGAPGSIPTGGDGDNSLGGDSGDIGIRPAGDGVDGPSGGWRPNDVVNIGSGGGGSGGGITAALRNGQQGGRFGGGGGGGGAGVSGGFPNIGSAGAGYQGAVLAINNPSL